MKYLLDSKEMKACDRATSEIIGIPAAVLMERAALAVCERVRLYFSLHPDLTQKKVFILAGRGNNGADGLAVARLLSEESYSVSVYLTGDETKESDLFTLQKKILVHYPVNFCDQFPTEEYNIVIDAMFGVGLSRPLSGDYLISAQKLEQMAGYRIAVDIPSGISSDNGRICGTAVHVDETVTFGFLKRGQIFYPGCEYCGKVILADVGITSKAFIDLKPGMFMLDESDQVLPVRTRSGNKGTFGKVLLIAGCDIMAGAAVLGAKSCLRSGAGMVKVISHDNNREILLSVVPEALFGNFHALTESLDWCNVIAIGPGIGTSVEAGEHLLTVLKYGTVKKLVLDADALNLIAKDERLRSALKEKCMSDCQVVLTPHVGELARLCGRKVSEIKADLPMYAANLAMELQCVVAAKDARTVIVSPDGTMCVNTTGNSALAKAGSGDVLTGVIAAFMAQGMDAFSGACAGCYVHGKAALDFSREFNEYACTASALCDYLCR